MSDLIDRQAVIEVLTEFADDDLTSTGEAVGADHCVDLIKALPSAERHGRWLRPRPVPQVWSLFMADCSECGKITYMGDYCMECGAKMERDDE